MTNPAQKIVLSSSRDIPFNKLILSQANVRRIKTGVSIEELAEDIARRTLLQSLNVRSVVDAEGKETGMFEVPAGGRRFRALELLVKQKRMAKTQPVPCVIRTEGLAEEDSIVENMQREALHPLDQFRSFQTLRAKGLSEEDIAARFFVSATIVKQRLKLAAVSPKLLELYAEDEISLDQLMAFTVTNDHARQEQVWEALAKSYNKEPYAIRRQLTERAVQASDRRAQFVGLDAYQAAGGGVMRDLFTEDRGGWLQDPALLDRLVEEKLRAEAARIAGAEMSDALVRIIRQGQAVSTADFLEARAVRDRLKSEFDPIVARYQAIVTLPAVGVAPPFAEGTGDPIFSTVWSLMGAPAITLPLLKGTGGMPIGVQLVGRAGDDFNLVSAAGWVEREFWPCPRCLEGADMGASNA
jgi:ParB family chromosome partitioning protein